MRVPRINKLNIYHMLFWYKSTSQSSYLCCPGLKVLLRVPTSAGLVKKYS